MKILAIPDGGVLSKAPRVNTWADGESDRLHCHGDRAHRRGRPHHALLCGAGFLLLVIGAVMWVRED